MAIPSHLRLRIVTPNRSVIHDPVDEVVLPAAEGQVGVLPGHTPALVKLSVGELWYRKGQEKLFLSIALGFAEILPDEVTILTDVAERADEIDVARAEAARRRAQDRLLSGDGGDPNYEIARIALMKALTRLQVAARGHARG
jgi:F-type H+-transporting ATPase subunit epsilon